jgi:hypothetical protein
VPHSRHLNEVVHGSESGAARVTGKERRQRDRLWEPGGMDDLPAGATAAVGASTVTLTVPADESYLPVLRLLVAGALGPDTDPGVVDGLRRAVEDVARALLRQAPTEAIETRLKHDPAGLISIDMSISIDGSRHLDEPALLAVDRMLELLSLRSRRSLVDGVLNVAFSVRHVG